MNRRGFSMIEALMALGIAGAGLAMGAAWFDMHNNQGRIGAELPVVLKAATARWLDEYGYSETIAIHCIALSVLPPRAHAGRSCRAAKPSPAPTSAYDLMGKGIYERYPIPVPGRGLGTVQTDGVEVVFAEADCAVIIAKSTSTLKHLIGPDHPQFTAIPPAGDTPATTVRGGVHEREWNVVDGETRDYLDEDLAERWSFVLEQGRRTGWLLVEGSDRWFPWTLRDDALYRADSWYEDSRWASAAGEGGGDQGAARAVRSKSCFDLGA